MAQRSVPAGEENDAAAKLVDVEKVVVPDPEAADTSGPKMIRCRHNDEFQVRSDLRVDGRWREFPATVAKEIIAAARVNGVRLAVADVEKKG